MNEKYPLALPEGTILAGQYIVEKVLGQGGFGITYEAKDYKTNERVAVKEFFPDAMATRTNQTTVLPFSGEKGESYVYGKTCFLQEAETLAQFIGNENIVRIHSYFEENETAYFVMDFIEGTSFDDYLKQRGGKIPYEEAEKILIPVMDALSAVHSRGIVHRDVTPDNIYITQEGVVKLLDFGAARYSLGDQSRSLDIILKHGFAPKEQYTRRGKQGPYTDIYALGATFYFALTGKRPPDSVERLDEDDLVPPSSLGVQLSGAAEDAILKALCVQPADRFQTMMDFKYALLNTRQPAAAGQPAVVQTYFAPPEQSGIPRSGPVEGAAPGTGQTSELQDLAATMKTAGKLAGRLAGKMAGRMAEKSAETAGIMAGTAGKMAEIMAAKKAETAEKLAAKMAEREAEKAARQAEEAARQEAARQAEEAARQAALEAAAQQAPAAVSGAEAETDDESAVGTTANESAVEKTANMMPGMDSVGTTAGGEAVGFTAGGEAVGFTASGSAVETAAEVKSAPAKPANSKKLLLAVPVVAAVLLVGVFMLKPGKEDKAPSPSKNGTTTSVGTTTNQGTGGIQEIMPDQPADSSQNNQSNTSASSTLSGDFTPVGNYPANIMCNGYITSDSSGALYWISDGGHSVYSESEDKYIYENESGLFYDLSVDSGYLFFRYDNSAFSYNLKTGETEEVTYINVFVDNVVRFFVTKDYYIVGELNSDYTVTVCLIPRNGGKPIECCTALASNMFTISDDNMLYYIGREEDIASDSIGIYRVNMTTLERERQLLHTNDPNLRFQCPVVAGDSLYVICYDETDQSDYSILKVDRDKGYKQGESPIYIWDVSSQINQSFLTRVQLMLNVHPQTQDIYFNFGVVSDTSYYLYKIKGYEDESFDLELVSEKAYAPNILYFADGSYELDYMYRGPDDEEYLLYYSNYDKNGNLINN